MFNQMISRVGRALNYDFCPNYNKYVYWLKRPVGWVICAILFCALVGLLIGPQGFVLMWALLAFLVAGAVWPWLGMKGIHCQLEFDTDRSEEARATSGRLVVINGWPLPVFGLTVEGQFLQDIIEDDDVVTLGLKRIPAWSQSEFAWELKPARRGLLPQDAPVISTGFPFGLYQSEKPINVESKMVIWPQCEPLSAVRELSGAHFNIDGGFSDRPGYDGDVIGARPFRQGDSPKHINWSKTASSGKLVVLERQTAAQKAIQVVLDLNRNHYEGQWSHSSYEWSIRIAATVIKHLHLHHSRIRLTCSGLPLDQPSEISNARGLGNVLDFLAMLPTLEQLNTECSAAESRANRLSLGLRNGHDQVYWIGSESGYQARIENGDAIRSCDVIVPTNAKLLNTRADSWRRDAEHVLPIEDLGTASEHLRTGWEGLCHDA